MQRKTLLAAVLAAAFALPLAVQAANDKATAGKSASAGDGGAEAMFESLDRNGDGFISKDEAKGSPHAAEFATLDRNRDGKLSRAEHAASPGHAKAARSAANAKSGAPTSAADMATRKIQ
jgi:hypothetical protein